MTTITAGLAEQQQAESAVLNACQSTTGRASCGRTAGALCVVTCSGKCDIMSTASPGVAPHGRVVPPGCGGRRARAGNRPTADSGEHRMRNGGGRDNVLNPVKAVPEVCTIFCATANPVDVLVAVTDRGRGIVGVIDGQPPVGVETDADVADRR